MGEIRRRHLSETANKARWLLALAIALVLAMLCAATGGLSRAYATTSLATASANETKLPETEGLVAPYLKMDFAQLGLSATDGVSVKKASSSGVFVSGAAGKLDGASLKLANALTFDKDKPVGRVCLDGVAPVGTTVAVDVCFDDLDEPVARFTLRKQEKAGSWKVDGDLTHDALGDVPAGKHRVTLRLSVSGASAGKNVSILLRSIEFAQSSLPTIYLNLDAKKSDISAENKEKGCRHARQPRPRRSLRGVCELHRARWL